MTSIFIVLSGEHATLPFAEIESIIDSEGHQLELNAIYGDVAIIESTEKIYPLLRQRSAMALAAGRLLFATRPIMSAIIRNSTKHAAKLHAGDSICVRVRRYGGAHRELGRSKLEGEIGSALASEPSGGLRVDLRHPDISFLGIITADAFVLGELRVTIDRGAYDRRKPRSRPFFKPGVLEPRIARAFVNLSCLNSSKVFYDPFLGTGGFLVEACPVGRYAIGSDADLRMVIGARNNLNRYGFVNFDLFLADAGGMPLKKLECVSFDPPYGRATSTRKRRTEDLIQSSLAEIGQIMSKDGTVVMAYPSNIEVERKLPAGTFSIIGRHSMRVHRSLTRSILVLRRV